MNIKPASETTNPNEAQYETVEKYMVPLSNMVTFKPDQPIQDVISTIIEKKITGGPVLDDQHHLVGMISEKDCLRLIVDQAYHNMPAETRKVSDYMTAKVQSLSPQTNIVEAAIEFLNSPIRRFAIVENGMLIGQVSRRHILRAAQNIKSTTR
ncbi:MAG: CBS domain-containing protein [Bacteroidota bacterium]